MPDNTKKFKRYVRGNEYVLVKQGVSWPAFFFTFFWAFYKKAYKLGCIVFATLLFGQYIVAFFIGFVGAIMGLRIGDVSALTILGQYAFFILVPGILHYKGNKWVEKELVSKGFTEIDDTGNFSNVCRTNNIEKCPYCDNPLPDNARHCPSCGADLSK
jgi:hypothetical protein